MRCGHCKAESVTIDHVRGCASGSVITAAKTSLNEGYVQSKDFKPMVLTDSLPESMYCLYDPQGKPVFYEISVGKKGRWEGFQFLSRLVGHPGDFQRFPVKGESKKQVLLAIAADAKGAAVNYAKEFKRCGVCNSPLSDPESLAAGIGPVCAAKFS